VGERRFGLSTHLFHDHRLTREHLAFVAGHGFEAVEVFATRSHFDYRDDVAVTNLASWLADTRLQLHSLHAPIAEAVRRGEMVAPYSTASGDDRRRAAAVAEVKAALAVAARIPFRVLVLHLGVPLSARPPANDNQPGAARRSLEEIAAAARAVGVQVAVEVMPNPLSTPHGLVRLIEDESDELEGLGICLDYGHAHLMGDLGEAIEEVSGHLITTHVHDNRRRTDDHLPPFAGSIDWDMAMMETQKIGYDGVLMFEVADTGDAAATLQRCAEARDRLERTFVTFPVE
jgi:sugar phosphate isomerase/epimerase